MLILPSGTVCSFVSGRPAILPEARIGLPPTSIRPYRYLVLIQLRYAAAIADGSLTLTFRRWARSQVVAGRRYRTAAGMIEVEAVDIITTDQLTDADARAAGYPSAAALIGDLRGPADRPLFRVRFHGVAEPDPRTVLAADDALTQADVDAITTRLARLDRASSHGPWTQTTLDLIATRPTVRAPDLAASVGRETQPFKLDVRKLKALGLTHSLPIGYQLSPRGIAYRAARAGS
jgi:hypothetical protein